MLLSPMFLYRLEEVNSGQTPLPADELATRLSYFLWSSPPDDELKNLADNGELVRPEVLKNRFADFWQIPNE